MTITSTNAGVVANPGSNTALGGSATQRDLFLKKFSGLVLTSFNTKTVAKDLIRTVTIKSGKSYQFPAIGKLTAQHHQPGQVILGQTAEHGEKIINVDDLLVSDVFVSDFLQLMNHFSNTQEYAVQMADSLAQAYDQRAFAMMLKACLDSTPATGAVSTQGPATKLAIGTTPTIADIEDSFFEMQKHFDNNDIPQDGRCAVVTWDVWYDLIQSGYFLNTDYSGQGSRAEGRIGKVVGLPIVPSNNMAKNFGTAGTLTATATREGNTITDYNVDASTVKVLGIQKQAAGAVHLLDMNTDSTYQVEKRGTLMLTEQAYGMGVLRPECLYAVSAETTS